MPLFTLSATWVSENVRAITPPNKTFEMDKLRYYFPDRTGKAPRTADIVLYETPWNDFGFHGTFRCQFQKPIRYYVSEYKWLHICRIDGTMKKWHTLRDIYSFSDECFTELNGMDYISFPSRDLSRTLRLNFTKEERIQIAKSLCFNFGDDESFEKFRKTEQYKVSILRNKSEEDFLTGLKECKNILFNEMD